MHFNITCADVLDWAAEYDGPKAHAMLTDPPYSWGFMSKKWDNGIALQPETWAALAQHLHPGAFIMAFGGPRTYHRLACALEDAGLRLHNPLGWINGQGFPKATRIKAKEFKKTDKQRTRLGDKRPYDTKGDSIFAGNETGMVKEPATDLARVWQGHRYGLQSLKPSIEFIAVAQKPYEGRPVDCIVETGAGALNVDGGRIGVNDKGGWRPNCTDKEYPDYGGPFGSDQRVSQQHPQGRWPANFALCHSPGCRRAGVKRVKPLEGHRPNPVNQQADGQIKFNEKPPGYQKTSYTDPDGLETVDAWDCTEDCVVRLLGEQSGRAGGGFGTENRAESQGRYGDFSGASKGKLVGYGDKGTAARFFFQADWQHEIAERLAGLEMPVMYCPKSSGRERNDGLDDFYWKRNKASPTGFVRVSKEEWETLDEKQRARGNIHPTQKPISLTKYLATLLLPPKEYAPRRIFIPFAGKMSEGVGAMLAGFEEIEAAELIQDYCDAGKARMEFWSDGRQLELAL